MDTWILIILGVVVVIGLFYFLKKQRGGTGMPKKPEGPTAEPPPESPTM